MLQKLLKNTSAICLWGGLSFSVGIITILASMFLFKNINVGLYSAIALWISTSTMDLILQGLHFATLVFVVSGRAEEMSAVINQKLEREP